MTTPLTNRSCEALDALLRDDPTHAEDQVRYLTRTELGRLAVAAARLANTAGQTMVAVWPNTERAPTAGENTLRAAEAVLITHQRLDIKGCLCGWSELGRSHARHQVRMLDEAGVLAGAGVEPVSPAVPRHGEEGEVWNPAHQEWIAPCACGEQLIGRTRSDAADRQQLHIDRATG